MAHQVSPKRNKEMSKIENAPYTQPLLLFFRNRVLLPCESFRLLSVLKMRMGDFHLPRISWVTVLRVPSTWKLQGMFCSCHSSVSCGCPTGQGWGRMTAETRIDWCRPVGSSAVIYRIRVFASPLLPRTLAPSQPFMLVFLVNMLFFLTVFFLPDDLSSL